MITILVVGPKGPEPAAFAGSHPSVEVLLAAGTEDALEKLARNRRIDAVLLLPGVETAEFAQALAEEDPGAPPLFAPAGVETVPGVRALAASGTEGLLQLLVRALAAEA